MRLLAMLVALIVTAAGCALFQGTHIPTNPDGSPAASPTALATSPAGSTPGGASTPGGQVFIAMVELGPEDPSPGGTFVVIENRGPGSVDLGCWLIWTNAGNELVIGGPAVIPGGGGLRLMFARGDVSNPDRVQLRDPAGRQVDATPLLNDTASDDRLFGRTDGQWVLGRPALPRPLIEGAFVGAAGC
jgi:hypothetical protein